MSWWPYGEMAAALADAVLSGDQEKAVEQARIIKDEEQRRARYEEIISAFNEELEACRWDKAEKLLEQAHQVGGLSAHDLVRHQTALAFERDTVTVLDRMVGESGDDEE